MTAPLESIPQKLTDFCEKNALRIIATMQSGKVDPAQFVDSLSAQIQLSLSVIVEELSAKGTVKDVAFRGVGPVGGDVYDVAFENENAEWRIGLAPDGKIRFLFWQSIP